MGRKTKRLTIEAEGRDKGKTFLLTEMPAHQAEAWAIRAMGAMVRAGLDLTPDVLESGMVGMAVLGMRALMAAPYADTAPLLAEVMACVKVIMPAIPEGRPLVEDGNGDDIEEVATYLTLRDEVLELHVGFSLAATLTRAAAMILGDQASTDTPTPDQDSAPSSLPDSPPSTNSQRSTGRKTSTPS